MVAEHQPTKHASECEYVLVRLPQVLHFVGPRKKVLRLVHKAFMAGGAEGAYRMLSMLPHTEAELGALDLAAAEATLLPAATSSAAAAA